MPCPCFMVTPLFSSILQAVDLFGNNLTSGGDMIKLHVALNQASYNASFGRVFLSPLDTVSSAYRPEVHDDGLGRFVNSFQCHQRIYAMLSYH